MFAASFPIPATFPETRKNAHVVIALWQILANRFDEQELRTLCFCLGLDYDDLPATGKIHKARELVTFLDRRGAINTLISAGQSLRPDIEWDMLVSHEIDRIPVQQPVALDHSGGIEEPFHLLAQTMRTLAQALAGCREQTGEIITPQPYALYHCEGNTIVAVVALA